jgi:4-hydroxy-tetrahydrodipicolinate synthase
MSMPHPNANRLQGVLTAIVTPFAANGDLALEHMPALLEFQRQAGIDGVVVCGTNGEGTSLSVDERKRTLEAVLADRGGLKVIAATGAANLPDTIELTRHAASAGADGALVLPPFFFKQPTVQGLAAWFAQVLEAADLPILLYNIPHQSAIAISDELIGLLSDHANLSGIKDSAGDWDVTAHTIARWPQLRVFAGSDRLGARIAHTPAAAGSISGTANPFPEIIAGIHRAHAQDPHGNGAEAAQQRADALIDILLRYPLIAVSKSIMAHRGLPRLAVRSPLIDLTSAQEESLLAELHVAGLLSPSIV